MSCPSEILSRYRTDKNSGVPHGHTYGPFYDRVLPPHRGAAAVLEIGVQYGDSLRAWREYFPGATVHGVEIDPRFLFAEDRIETHLLDAADPDQLGAFAARHLGRFGVIIDDGSHRLGDQLLAARLLAPCLAPGGLMVIEDVADPASAPRFAALGFTVEAWDTNQRWDNRVAWRVRGSGQANPAA